MNGFSLLFVLATVGTTAQVELGPTGQPTYTIRVESVLLDQLRQGQEIKTNVGLKDRQVRRFRILVTPESASRNTGFQSRNDAAFRAESLVEYEPVQLENNEIEMWVQISPERLETLASGKPIEGEVASDVPEIQRFRIFVGVNQLPMQQPTANTQAPYLFPNNEGGLAPGANEVRPASDQSTRGNAPLLRSGNFQGNTTTTNPRAYSNNIIPAPRANDVRTALRNGPDPSTVAPPPVDRYGQSQPTAQTYPHDNRFGGASTGSRFDEQYAQQTYNDRNSAYPYQNQNAAPQQPIYNQNPNLAGPAYTQQQPLIAARPENPAAQTLAPANASNWATASTNAPAVAPPAAPVQPSTIATKPTEETTKPSTSTPLILTTLALFTSLGVNAYLGWLAWSFFWRYRDAVNDSARARSYNAPGRQAA